MKYLLLLLSALAIYSCESNSFDSDKRQLVAKNEIRAKLKSIQSFDIIGFKEDTLNEWPGSAFKNPIRYRLNVVYRDSAGTLQNKEAFVIFAPDGKSVIDSQIND